jgi:hypothetical protein
MKNAVKEPMGRLAIGGCKSQWTRRGKEGHSSFPSACLGSERTLPEERGPTEVEESGKAGTD